MGPLLLRGVGRDRETMARQAPHNLVVEEMAHVAKQPALPCLSRAALHCTAAGMRLCCGGARASTQQEKRTKKKQMQINEKAHVRSFSGRGL